MDRKEASATVRRTTDAEETKEATGFRMQNTGAVAAQKQYKFATDKLGKLIQSATELFRSSDNWESFVRAFRGTSHLATDLEALPHPAGEFLEYVRREGVPAHMHTAPPTADELQARMKRGPHKSSEEAKEFIREEMAEFHDKSFWVILPFELVKHLPGLRISPLGSIPQRDRRPRLINDLTFYQVNDDTVKFAPPSSMQFGKALERLLHKVRHANPAFGPVYMNKIDIADGFYRMWLRPDSSPALACAMPQYEGEPPLVAIPIALPMGWVESPPSFCAMTETIADLANARMHRREAPLHRLEHHTEPPPISSPSLEVPPTSSPSPEVSPTSSPSLEVSPTSNQAEPTSKSSYSCVPSLASEEVPSNSPLRSPLSYTDIYVDDFCNLVQGDDKRRRVVTRILLHTIDEVLRPLDPNKAEIHNEPASVKKLKKGDGTWATLKIILGWLIDTVGQTIRLPKHRSERLVTILDSLDGRKRVCTSEWHKILGELRSMSLAVPGARGLFSALQTGFQQKEATHRVRIDRNMRIQLEDFKNLARDLHDRPTNLAEIIPDVPSGIGAVDASKHGMGGVIFCPGAPPLLWREAFSNRIQKDLVGDDNPNGSITNSDLELAGIIAHNDVLAQHIDVRNRTVGILNDNIPALVWMEKGSTSTQKPANQLLRLAGFHQRHHRYLARYDHISGKDPVPNCMADDASRLFDLNDAEFLSHFNSVYPQKHPWQLCPLRSEMHSALTSCLFRKPAVLASVLNVPEGRITPGECGNTFATSTKWTPFWKTSKMRYHTSKSSPNDIATVALQKAVTPSDLEQWRTPYVPSVRRWPAWGPTTNAWQGLANTSTACPLSSRVGNASTPRLNDASQFPSESSTISRSTPQAHATSRLPTCASSVSSSSVDLANTSIPETQTPSQTPFGSMTWNSAWREKCFQLKTHPWNPWKPLGPSRWSTPTRKTPCATKGYRMGSPAIPSSVLCALSNAKSCTSAVTTPLAPHHWGVGTTTTGAPTESPPPCSPPQSEPPPPGCTLSSASLPKTSRLAGCARAAPLLCSVGASTQSSGSSLVGGNQTKCSNISMSALSPSCSNTRN